jgi:hypothetical protein
MHLEYHFARDRHSSGFGFDIDNPDRPKTLAKEIEAALPGLSFQVSMSKTNCCVLFDEQLTLNQRETLESTVNNHKRNLLP